MASEEYLLDNQIEYDTKLCQLKHDAKLCQNTNIKKEKDSYIMKKLLILLCSILFLGSLNASHVITCPDYELPNQFRGLWGDKWNAPNKVRETK